MREGTRGRTRLVVGFSIVATLGGLWMSAASGVMSPQDNSDVEFVSRDGVKLAGTIVRPAEAEGPLPGAVVVHGSGRVNRAGQRRRAAELVDLGFAVLIYDKRGVGESGGTYSGVGIGNGDAMMNLLADDAAAALEAMVKQPGIDAARVGFVGASQAGWIMPLAASKTDQAKFIVSIVGPTVTIGQEIYYSQLTGDDPGGNSRGELTDDEIARRLEAYDGPDGFDPMPVLMKLKTPSLWLLGGDDRSVPTELCIKNFEKLRGAGNESAKLIVYPGGGHNLSANTPMWRDIAAWLAEQKIIVD